MPLLLVAGLLTLAAQTVGERPLSYAETVRCAGLTQAASEMEGGESAAGRSLSDAALFWSLSAAQAATAMGKTEAESDRDQTTARVRAVGELSRNLEQARGGLATCQARTPNLG